MPRQAPKKPGGFVTLSGLPRWQTPAIALAILLVLWATAGTVGMEPHAIAKGTKEFLDAAKSFVTMPEWSFWNDTAKGLEETIEMALVGTVVALPVSFLFAMLCARNTSIHPVLAFPLKALLAVLRGVPFFCWAMLIVAAAGLGVLSGTLTLALTSTFYTAKVFSESLEVVSPGPIEAMQSVGAGWLEVRRYGILPQAVTDILGQSLYTFESNIRLSTALGIVGAGGIGYEFSMALRNVNYNRAVLILLSILLLVTAVDRASQWVRKRLR